MMKFYWLQGQRGEGLVRLKHVVIDANHEKAPKKPSKTETKVETKLNECPEYDGTFTTKKV